MMENDLNFADTLSALNLASLPTMPMVAVRVHKMLEDEDVAIAKLVHVIQSDPAVVARMVKMANSSFYGSRREIRTIPDAIMTIGLSALRGTVLQAALQELYQPFGPTEIMLWEHANAVAMASRFLASHLRPALAEEAFLAGLLHDIGMLVLNWTAPEKFSLVLTHEELDSEANFATDEFDVFKVSHGEVGGWVLRNWEFPEELISVAKDHHNFLELTADSGASPEQPPTSWLTTLVSLADVICLKAGIGYQRNEVAEWENLPHLSLLGFDAHRIDQLSNEFLEIYIEEWQYMVS